MFWIKLLQVSVSLVKKYTSFIWNVEKKPFCLVNSAFPFVGPQEPISYSKAAKVFYAYEG